ncbi:Peptidase aspartic catalytic [Macrophomina phaseolina MS6]|uniref:Peptidase aspartic catalytic n=1 Tax=Macrophomina phaseolina (strain MS6) TaxID=1126212 RepID=K2RZ27_MACPH|nr:Peptidase aspartic catalytic [Macrophomina phaseolina MS6]
MRDVAAGLPAFAFSIFLLVDLSNAAANLNVPWSTTSYGPDGPWHAVSVQVGGVKSQGTTQIDLIPSGTYGSMILSDAACDAYPDTPCGKGGTWELAYTDTTGTNFRGGWYSDTGAKIGDGETFVQAMTVNGQTVSSVPLISVDNIAFSTPAGKKYGPQVGTMALGGSGSEQAQYFSTATSDSARSGFMVTGGLFNQSIIPSYSYLLHVGAAGFDYGGSLVLGGYDKGRTLGTYTNYTGSAVELLDIGIGVETGGSPFSDGLKTKTGLLLNNTSEQTTLQVGIDPGSPYMYLPGKTCEEIAKNLPVRYDTTLRYYLWDVDDPDYEKVVTSPAHLSFVFASGNSDVSNVTIKVPFALLNLTLDTPIVTKPTPYFPCNEYEPASGKQYRLGRSFLQAAFIGHNFRTSMTWLGQAPGPGPSRNGLGEERRDIADDDVSIETSEDDGSTFADSWSSHWTVLADDGSGDIISSPTPTADSSSTGNTDSIKPNASSSLSVGGIIGIVAGAVIILLATVLFTGTGELRE